MEAARARHSRAMRGAVVVVLSVAAALGPLAACSHDNGGVSPNPGGDAGASASATIGPAGGVVQLGQASLTIPPGALAQPTTITIVLRTDAPPPPYTAYSPFYEFDPAGLVFALPATVVLPEYGAPPAATIQWSSSAGSYQSLPTTRGASADSAQVAHFSTGFVGLAVPADASADDAPTDAIDAAADDGPAEASDARDVGAMPDAPVVPPSDADVCPVSDAGSGGGLPDGAVCATPYTPGWVACNGTECNVLAQVCCTTVSPSCLSKGHSCSGDSLSCDGPEDCPAGQACVHDGTATMCEAASACDTTFGTLCPLSGPFTSLCQCHSAADCPAAFPYCYIASSCTTQFPHCQANPPPSDAGADVPCAPPDAGAPPAYAVACGDTSCLFEDEQCCAGACQCRTQTCSSLIVQCDGPEDCPSGQTCCATSEGVTAAYCTGQCGEDWLGTSDGVVCHTVADCPAGITKCVPYADGGYGISLCSSM